MNKKWLVLGLVLLLCSMATVVRGSQLEGSTNGEVVTQPAVTQWYVSTLGKDTNDCANPATPCAKIVTAVQKAASGAEILVASGTYTNTVVSDKLAPHLNISISGGWDEAFSAQEGMSTIEGQNLAACIETIAQTEVNISRLILAHCGKEDPNEPAILNHARLTITDGVVQDGHHIENVFPGELTMDRCEVKHNHGINGGGIYSSAKLLINRCAIHHNNAEYGGGGLSVSTESTVIINSTINDNVAWLGGGIHADSSGSLSLYNSTIFRNQAPAETGGLAAPYTDNVFLFNSLLANNTIGDPPAMELNCFGTVNSGGYNLIGSTVGCGFVSLPSDVLNIPPRGALIGTNYVLTPASPAIDAGNPTGCKDDLDHPLIVDQRGSVRPLDGNGDGTLVCDIGAYEFNPGNPPRFAYLPFAKHPCPDLYFDDFSDPASGWPAVATNEILLEYNSGEYRSLIKPVNWWLAARAPFTATNYKASLDLRNVTGVAGSYGIIFGLSADWSGWYSLELFPDGWFGLYRYGENGAVLAESYSPAIQQGSAINHIRIERENNHIRAYANGQILTDVFDSYYMGNLYLGLINFSYDQPNVDIRFDNFRVTPINCNEASLTGGYSTLPEPSWMGQALSLSGTESNFSKHQP